MTQYSRHLNDRAWFWIAFLAFNVDLWFVIVAIHTSDFQTAITFAPMGLLAFFCCVQLHAPLEFNRDQLTR